MSVLSSSEIVKTGQAYVVRESGLCCARCYASHGLICELVYRYAPTWGFSGRPKPRWVETFSCAFCRNEINQVESRLPIHALALLVEVGGSFYDRDTREAFLAYPELHPTPVYVEPPPEVTPLPPDTPRASDTGAPLPM
jgi:hypothetical protein